MSWIRTILGTPGSTTLGQALGPYTHLTLTDATAQLLLNPGTITFPLLTDTVALIAASQTLTNKILTSPTINGTYAMGGTMTIPQALMPDADATRAIGAAATGWQRAYLRGTGGVIRYDDTTIMGVVEKTGSGSGTDYTIVNTTAFTDIDTANLNATYTIPTGWKLEVDLSGQAYDTAGQNGAFLAIVDGSTVLAGATAGQTAAIYGPFRAHTVIAGDGASHVIHIQFRSNTGASTTHVMNASDTSPSSIFGRVHVTYRLMPSN